VPRRGDHRRPTSHTARLTPIRARAETSTSLSSQGSLFPLHLFTGRPAPANTDSGAHAPPTPGDHDAHVEEDTAPSAPGEHDPPSARDPPDSQQTPRERPANVLPLIAAGDKAKARDILAAIDTLTRIEHEARPATPEERQVLARFPGFGAVALSLFPDPQTGRYKDTSWQSLGEQLRALLTPEEYTSARRTVTNAYYTSSLVIGAMHEALARLGVPQDATVLEPGCGSGNFIRLAPPGMHFIGVEKDSISGRIARALYPDHDIRIEDFVDTRLPAGRIDAVIGNVPFMNDRIKYQGQRLALHDFFLAKSLDALQPGGVLALVTSHFTLDKQNAGLREHLAEQADFLGAIRLPLEAFKREGTSVVTDILFLRKRVPGEPARHADPDWLRTQPLTIDGVDVPINVYFHHHPAMVLGDWTREKRPYAASYGVFGHGDLAEQLQEAIERLPEGVYTGQATEARAPPPTDVTAPPLLPHITEGSFFVGDDHTIMQVVGGEGVPVTNGGKPLKDNGTMAGQRLGMLIQLRDHYRHVLRSQNEGWPEAQRRQARAALNRLYDRFVAAYGPINKTTFSTTEDGTVVRRMPNLFKFRDDPDAVAVMALEEYDEVTGKATKADIMYKDVVGPTPPVTTVPNAEEGLLVSLNHRGMVDLPYIATLYGAPVPQIIAELGDLIYQDPESAAWQTADEYLSGNVRAKLAAAEQAGAAYARNTEALRAVQPEDVLPGDIDANLGAPWIPEDDIRDFAAALFHMPPETIRVGHLKTDALWSLDADIPVKASVAATTEHGTSRANGVDLLEDALNLRAPSIYDTVKVGGKEERILNQEATLAAREKQKTIKERFRHWIFADPERTERLVQLYNTTFNNIRLRSFDGSHLDFPGMNQNITLAPHQTAAVWRGMSSGNTLLAHCVGAGKTFVMAATGMKMKQTGLCKKPIFEVPNHMLEQFGREFMQLYPNAHLLIATKEDFTRERRKLLTAKIANGDWDGIIVTHSSAEHIGMSQGEQAQFLREQIEEYDRLLCDSARDDTSKAQRNIIKAIEKQKQRREQRLKELLAEEKKDDGLVFDELGIDQLFVDEAQAFKNLETPTKMERVAGIQTGGSERAYDLFMKTRYLDTLHPGHGVCFASGTPISNSMGEMYTLQRFLDPAGLRERGIGHFDSWAANFGDVVETMEISPDGASLRPRSRFARFMNLPELQQMFRAFADVKTADMLNLPRPRLKGGQPMTIACPMSKEQCDIQSDLVARYDRLRNGKVDPREDNALAITTDGRKLALTARLLSASAPDCPDSKINALVENVAGIWQRTTPERSTQLIFCDMGVNPTAWGYSVYQEIIDKLVAHGLPRAEIATIGEADTDAKKQVLFEKVRNGTIRVLLGSTQKMGMGTNVQKRLIALHHLDAPWKPAEVEQRDGRILRQKNTNEEVEIYRYVTEGSFDAYMWQALETKARFINQIMTGDSTVRRAEDIGGQELSYAEVKAIASGNPAVLTLAQADAELQRLTLLHKHHADEQFKARRSLRTLPETIGRLAGRIADLTKDIETAAAHAAEPLTIGTRTCPREDAMDLLATRLQALPAIVHEPRTVPLGLYRGLRFGLDLHPLDAPRVSVEGATTRFGTLSREFHGARAVLNAVERIVQHYDTERDKTRQDLAIAQGQQRDFQARLGAEFAHEGYRCHLKELRDLFEKALAVTEKTPEHETLPPVGELVDRIKALKEANTIESAPERSASRRAATIEESVTTRIRHRAQAHAAPQPETADEHDVPADAPPETATQPDDPPPPPRTTLFTLPPAHVGQSHIPLSHEQRVTRKKARAHEQRRLF